MLYEYTIQDDHVIITKYNGKEKNIVVPGHIEGLPVTVIGESAFEIYDYKPTSLFLPDTIHTLQSKALHITNITSIHLPSQLTYCQEDSLPKNITGSKFVDLPDTFHETKALKNVRCSGYHIKDTNPYYYASGSLLLNANKDTLILQCDQSGKTVNLPESIKYIDDFAFSCCDLEEIDLCHIVSIGESSFRNCSLLKKVRFSKELKKIPQFAFANCDQLKEADLPDTIEEIDDYAFSLCHELEVPHFPAALKRIGSYAFENCYKIKDYDFPEALETIADQAFYRYGVNYAGDTQKLSFSSSIKYIGDYSFLNNHIDGKIVLPSSVTYLGEKAFYNASTNHITSIFSPLSITKYNDWVNEEVVLYMQGVPVNSVKGIKRKYDVVLAYLKMRSKNIEVTKQVVKKNDDFIKKNLLKLFKYVMEKPHQLPYLLSQPYISLDELDHYFELAGDDILLKNALLNYKNKFFTKEDISYNEEQKDDHLFFGYNDEELKELWKLEINSDGFSYNNILIDKEKDFYDITGYNGTSKSVMIPYSIDGIRINEIDLKSGKYLEMITEVEFDEGFTEIHKINLEKLVNLKRIILPSSLQTLDPNLFYRNNKIDYVYFYNPDTELDVSTFYRNKDLTFYSVEGKIKEFAEKYNITFEEV